VMVMKGIYGNFTSQEDKWGHFNDLSNRVTLRGFTMLHLWINPG